MIIYPFETMWKDITKYIREGNIKKYTSPHIKTCKSPNIKYIQRNISTEQFMKFESPWIL